MKIIDKNIHNYILILWIYDVYGLIKIYKNIKKENEYIYNIIDILKLFYSKIYII